jgi:hypothetical protein
MDTENIGGLRSKRPKFRVGQRVQSVYDSTHSFVIGESQIPERIYREKDSDRWWTRNELQRLGAPDDPVRSIRLNGKEKMHRTHSNAFSTNADGPLPVAAAAVDPNRKCDECGVAFRPTRPWQKFHSRDCRLAHWKRTASPVEPVSKPLEVLLWRERCRS